MAAHLHQHLLYRSPGVTIYDVRCRPSERGCGPEEYSRANHIVFLRSGVFLRKINGEDIVADPNQVLFFKRHESYRVAHPVEGGDDCTVFAFAPEVLSEAMRVYQPRVEEHPDQPFEFSHVLSTQPLFVLQQQIRQRALMGNADGLMLDELALSLLGGLARSAYERRGIRRERRRPATVAAHREQAERTRLLLAGRFKEDLGLGEISRLVHCSPFHLVRIFRRETGLALHQYRNRLRLRAGLERVVSGESDLTALALDLGYSSHSHFTDCFRRAFGLPPSECRRSASSQRVREMSKNLEVAKPALV